MRIIRLAILVSLGFLALSHAQDAPERVMKEGLIVEIPGAVSRGILSLDPIEAMMIADRWNRPVAGDRVMTRGDTLIWEAIAADSNGWFSHRAMRNAYIVISHISSADTLLIIEAMGATRFFINGVPRIGSKYGVKEDYASWEPRFDYALIPVPIRKGHNTFCFRCQRGRLKVRLTPPESPVMLSTRDITCPDLLTGEPVDTWGSVLLINGSSEFLSDFRVVVTGAGLERTETEMPVTGPMTVRKIPFRLVSEGFAGPGKTVCRVAVCPKGVDRDGQIIAEIPLEVKDPLSVHRRTFISTIDSSVQYYAVNPSQGGDHLLPALVLSVHGASVEAINQASAYSSKGWTHVVAPTNRRPYGYDWEDWGRIDAMEVLKEIKRKYPVDEERIYLTGHSMGGHGTWHLGAVYPDRFAAIGPSAGWISFASYAPRQGTETPSKAEAMLDRAMLPGDTEALADNYKHHGVYILHGDADRSVPVEQARRMAEKLAPFHKDFRIHEEAGAGHWWDKSDEPGADCVDWAPMFDFFSRHARPGKERVRQVDFVTASPGVSASCQWMTIAAQEQPYLLSSVSIRFDPHRLRFAGSTRNVKRLGLEIPGGEPHDTVSVILDTDSLRLAGSGGSRIWLERDGLWRSMAEPLPSEKGPHRNGPFKEAFSNGVQLVYGTAGNEEENSWACQKARFDAECFWYQGNGSVDVIPDREFDPEKEVDRNVVLYGNASTNLAWKPLLGSSPVQVARGRVKAGKRHFKGKHIACLFLRPRPGSKKASVGVVSGTGPAGMKLSNTRPYLYAGYALPDLTIFAFDDQLAGSVKLIGCGFFGIDWQMKNGDFEWVK